GDAAPGVDPARRRAVRPGAAGGPPARLHGGRALGRVPHRALPHLGRSGERLAVSVIGTAVDAPSSDIALGILGLLALAAGRPAPQAEEWERAGAQGGAADGRARPAVLAEQPAVSVTASRDGSSSDAGD